MLTLLFPGQGSQYSGMHNKWMEFNIFKDTISEASHCLNIDFLSLLKNGSEEELKQTSITQPLILTVSTGICRVMEDRGYKGKVVLGHSLGSYSALVASGVILFEDGLKITRKRGELVEEYLGRDFKGGLVAIIGLTEDEVREAFRNHPELDITNINTHDQIVVGGKEKDLEPLILELKDKKVKAYKLAVSHPFHTRYLKKAVPVFRKYISVFSFKKPIVHYLSPSLGERLEDGEVIKDVLAEELVAPVNFVKAVKKARELGATSFMEVGPKDVLTRLMRKIHPDAQVVSVDLEEDKVLKGEGNVA